MRNFFKIINALQRRIISVIDKNYTKKKLAKRKGECKKCGKCCENCKFLNKKTNLCKIYDNRPWNCHKDFPLTKLDQKIWGIKNCGYYFEN